jgi:hypothetical protein
MEIDQQPTLCQALIAFFVRAMLFVFNFPLKISLEIFTKDIAAKNAAPFFFTPNPAQLN